MNSKCIQEAGFNFTKDKCQFVATENGFLGTAITSQGVKPQEQNVQNFAEKTNVPMSKMALQRRSGFLNSYRNYVLILSERLAPSTRCLKVTKRS